jgi:hypothetical protein
MMPLIFVVYPVDDLDPRQTVSDHHDRFCAIPSFLDLVCAPSRVVPVGGPSCVVPFARSLIFRGASLLVDAVNAHLTPVIAANRFLRGRCQRGKTKKKLLLQR